MSGAGNRASRTTAQEQLERLLYILPAAARENGATVADLARALDVEPAVILRDLREATARSFNQPAGAVESFTLFTDGHRVHVHAPHEFNRPVRLTQREALAVGLGLRMLAAAAEPDRRAHILALAARLERELAAPGVRTVHEMRADALQADVTRTPAFDIAYIDIPFASAVREPPAELEYDAELMIGFDDDGFRGVVADAIELGRTCLLWYLKPGDLAPEHRQVAPYRLIHASGMWYVAAYDLDREDLRFFRLDRVLDAALGEQGAPPPPDGLDALLANHAPYIAAEDVEVRVRYSPRVARWILERASGTVEADGSVIVRHRVADPRWIVRHVLQYAGDAVIEEPAPARRWVVTAASLLAEPAD